MSQWVAGRTPPPPVDCGLNWVEVLEERARARRAQVVEEILIHIKRAREREREKESFSVALIVGSRRPRSASSASESLNRALIQP